ncbi:MAG TPA: hypothetical protein VGL13_02985 [Polyangiaceae bacterium]
MRRATRPARRAFELGFAAMAASALLAACGYRPLYGGGAETRFCVVGASPLVADSAVVAEVEAGIRGGLARAGALRSGRGYPRVVVEVLRLDETSEGIAAVPGGTSGTTVGGLPLSTGGPLAPLARGTRVGVLGQAWIEESAGGARERETGDMRATDVRAAEPDARLEALRQDDAARASARKLGERLARRILGEPETSDDGM